MLDARSVKLALSFERQRLCGQLEEARLEMRRELNDARIEFETQVLDLMVELSETKRELAKLRELNARASDQREEIARQRAEVAFHCLQRDESTLH